MKLTHRVRTIAATALLTVAGCSAVLAMASSSLAATSGSSNGPRAAVQCRINFQASSLNLGIGQDLVLSWTAVGADKLTASWTTGFVPFVGAVTTTMSKPGTFSYQVTGTSNGLYCGGAGVEVKFTGAAASSSSSAPQPVPTTTTRNPVVVSSSAPPAGNGGTTTTAANGGGGGNNGGATTSANGGGNGNEGATAGSNNGGGNNNATFTGNGAGASSGAAGYPIQSPTGGSGVPWYQDPLHLLAISALALMGSLLLWRREQLRAVFIHRH